MYVCMYDVCMYVCLYFQEGCRLFCEYDSKLCLSSMVDKQSNNELSYVRVTACIVIIVDLTELEIS